MTADAAWRVTGFVLRVSSWFYLAFVENDWRAACGKLSWFPSVLLSKIMRGEILCHDPRHSTDIFLVVSGGGYNVMICGHVCALLRMMSFCRSMMS